MDQEHELSNQEFDIQKSENKREAEEFIQKYSSPKLKELTLDDIEELGNKVEEIYEEHYPDDDEYNKLSVEFHESLEADRGKDFLDKLNDKKRISVWNKLCKTTRGKLDVMKDNIFFKSRRKVEGDLEKGGIAKEDVQEWRKVLKENGVSEDQIEKIMHSHKERWAIEETKEPREKYNISIPDDDFKNWEKTLKEEGMSIYEIDSLLLRLSQGYVRENRRKAKQLMQMIYGDKNKK